MESPSKTVTSKQTAAMSTQQIALHSQPPSPSSVPQLNHQPCRHLLDLPNQLLLRVFANFKATLSIKKSVRLRAVNSSFRQHIDTVLFRGSYFKDQIAYHRHHVSPAYLTQYLIFKVIEDHQQQNVLSRLAYGAVSVILDGSYRGVKLNEETLRNHYTVVLCRAMAFFLEIQALDVFDSREEVISRDKVQAALIAAAAMRQDDLLCQLLDEFAGNPALNTGDNKYFGSLMTMAALNGHTSTVKLLISHGFPIDFLGLLTTLQAASISGNLDLVTLLLRSYDDDVKRRNYEYQSAILYAISNHHSEVALFLFHNSTLPDTTMLKRTIYCAAAKEGLLDIVTEMIEAQVNKREGGDMCMLRK